MESTFNLDDSIDSVLIELDRNNISGAVSTLRSLKSTFICAYVSVMVLNDDSVSSENKQKLLEVLYNG